ncbi:hypothetical protein [Pedobacter glucosidilyticus]|uniref:oxidoreductase n=1 Tax=Pedobacter glucosidilyticus TaxID=1122941 RepID=UPI0026EBEEF1|nr:hypothetical protein [Pedobacter glucosidilyticus]
MDLVPADLRATVRANFKGALIWCGAYDLERANQDLQDGKADLIAFGKPFISNPDLIERLKQNVALAQPDFNTLYTPDEKGYTDYPAAV